MDFNMFIDLVAVCKRKETIFKKTCILTLILLCALGLNGCQRQEQTENNDMQVENESISTETTESDECEPFYEYYHDGKLMLTLYYDEESQSGYGIRHAVEDTDSEYSFTFDSVTAMEWSGFKNNYKEIPQSPIFQEQEDWLINYDDTYEYNENGQAEHIQATGVIMDLDKSESSVLLNIDYEYDKNQKLRHRYYYHHSLMMGTYGSIVDSYFDKNERLVYEYTYVTHGRIEDYYIYEADSDTPSYHLYIDYYTYEYIPEFIRYE